MNQIFLAPDLGLQYLLVMYGQVITTMGQSCTGAQRTLWHDHRHNTNTLSL